MNKITEKEKLNNALKEMKIFSDVQEAQKRINNHIGFKKEKEKFLENVRYYILFQGKLRPKREITCYSGPPGVGKTTFVQTLKNATGRPLEIVPCAGLADPAEYSILEKVKNEKIQADLIKLFEDFTKKGTYFDPYFQQEIDLKFLDFFAAVNYDEKLATKLKDKVNLKRLLGYDEKEKMQILQKKRAEMQKSYNLKKGVRKLEQACHKIIEEYIYAKQTNKKAFQGDKQKSQLKKKQKKNEEGKMNRIVETIEREKIVKKYRRGGEKDNPFLGTVPESVKLENNKISAEFNNKPGIFYDDAENDKELFIYIYEIKEYLKENNIDKLSISEIQRSDFSRVNLLAGEEYNQELTQLEDQINLIDFNQHNQENPEFMERKIKEIYNNPQNQELMKKGEFPVICFKNIEKIGKNQALEEALLPVFDSQQNAELFNKEVDLSKFILIATTSTYETEKLSDPLLSRLD
ncbi:2816_t:CDS:2 [Entrophospora sp. SA101]|nr:2816_t:CDS:2 [Entrophospora sp. SA101]